MTGHVLTKSKREMECCMLDVAVIIANITFLAGFKTNKTNQKKSDCFVIEALFSTYRSHKKSFASW